MAARRVEENPMEDRRLRHRIHGDVRHDGPRPRPV